jgi:hypothetical protein
VEPRAQSGEEREGKRQGELRDEVCFWRTERGEKTRTECTGGTEGESKLCMLNQGTTGRSSHMKDIWAVW